VDVLKSNFHLIFIYEVIFLNYIVSAQGGLYCFFGRDGGLFWCRHLGGGSWSAPSHFRDRGVVDFSVSLCEGRVLIICQSDSEVEHVFFDRGIFETTKLLKGGVQGSYFGLPLEDETFLTHNMPITGDYTQVLMSHRVDSARIWRDSRHLGRVIPLSKKRCFEIVPIRDQHFLLFYQAQGNGFGGDLGYREVYGEEMGRFNVVHQNANINGGCHSFLANTDGFHMVYMTKGLLVPSLNYIKRDKNGLSKRLTVAQGHNVHSPVLYFNEGQLNLLYMRGEDVFVCSFGDGEKPVVTPPIKQEGTAASTLRVSKYLHENKSQKDFISNEIVVCTHKPWKIKIFNEFL